MNFNSLKLALCSFDYYLLKITPTIDLAQVEIKVESLLQFDKKAKYIALEIEEKITDLKAFNQELAKLEQKLKRYHLEIKFIQKNQYSTEGLIIPIYQLPTSFKSQFIQNQTLVIDYPVRGGVKIENDGDIIIVGMVANNAEIMASQNIHVYGSCRGKLFAGAAGNKKAKIFTTEFNPEIISIAGVIKVLEEKLPVKFLNQAVNISLDERNRLNINLL